VQWIRPFKIKNILSFEVIFNSMDFLYKPWPWYLAGAIIGLTVPLLLMMDNKRLGISSSLRHICAACVPASIPLFKYDWKKEIWNLYFAGGVLLGGFIGGVVFANPDPVAISESTQAYIQTFGVSKQPGLMPVEIFNWNELFTSRGFILMIVGGFLVGFGTRYARGCTSGHGITGLAALQWPSLVATASFFGGGILFSYYILPHLLSL
jgi:uncharacterized membrane protein YedE/YeeE